MIRGLAILLIFQSLGEVAASLIGGAVPGPVIGLVLLLTFLVVRKKRVSATATPSDIDTSVASAADRLLSHLSIFFIPAAVGVMLYVAALTQSGAAWILAIVLSTVATITVTALVLRWLSKSIIPAAPSSPAQPQSGDSKK
jgi:holin-like protein